MFFAWKRPTIDMTEGKCVGGKAPSALLGDHNVQVLVGEQPTMDMSEGKTAGSEAPLLH